MSQMSRPTTTWSPPRPTRRFSPPELPQKHSRFLVSDYLFWMLMLTVNVPNLLEIWGIETIWKPYRVLSIILAILAIPVLLREKTSTRRFSVPLAIAMLYVGALTVIYTGSDVIEQIPLIGSLLCLYLAPYVVSSRRSLLIGIFAAFISLSVSAGYGIFRYAHGEYRLTGLFTNPNGLGYACCFAILLAANRSFRIPRILRWVIILSTLGIVIFSGSRGAILAVCVALTSQLWRQPRLFWALAWLTAGGLVSAFYFSEQIEKVIERNNWLMQRYSFDLVERGTLGRLAGVNAALDVAKRHAFMGVGLEQFRRKFFTDYFIIYGRDGKIQRLGAHNTYATLLCEWGFIGFGCFALVFYRLVRDSYGMLGERDWAIGFVYSSMMMGISTDLLTDVTFWIMLGATVQLIGFAKKNPVAVPIRPLPPRYA